MKFYFFFLLFCFQRAISQGITPGNEDPYKMEIQKNIFRGTLALMFTELRAMVSYEREIFKPFTLVLKTGPSLRTDNSSPENEIELAATASGELRYYFNLRRRIKHNKTVRNFSAGYLSLEPFVISKPLIISDQPGDDERAAQAIVYINIGAQKQFKRFYLNAFFGTPFFGRIYSNSVDVFDIIQGGIVIGRVF